MMENLYKDFKQNMFAIHQLTERDKKHENAQTFFGELWEIFNPLIMTVVLSLVFGEVLKTDSIKNYPAFILTGTTFFNLYSSGTTACLNSLIGNKNLLLKSKLKRDVYVVQKIILVLRGFLLSLFIYAFVLALYRYTPSFSWLLVILDIVLYIFMILGIGKILSIFNVFFADITYFYRIFVVFLFYGSALFYDVTRYPIILQKIMIINPIYDVVYIAREAILNNHVVSINYWCGLIVYSIGLYCIGTHIFNKYSNNIMANL